MEQAAYYQEYAKLGVQGVPTLLIGDEVMVGFNPAAVMAKLPYTIESCPNCSKRMKLPKNKGTIKVTCPHCDFSFTFKTAK